MVRSKVYLLFLKFESDPAAVQRKLMDQHEFAGEGKDAIDLIKCNGIIPGFIANATTVWEVVPSNVIFLGILPEDLPKEISTYGGAGEWWVHKEELFSYIRTLGHGN